MINFLGGGGGGRGGGCGEGSSERCSKWDVGVGLIKGSSQKHFKPGGGQRQKLFVEASSF